MTEPHTTDQLARLIRDQIVRNAAQGRPAGRHREGELGGGRKPVRELILRETDGWREDTR
jgi:hypothetical protein